ncbi:MAG: acylphosphatase [Brevefilum sp.]
MTEQDIHRLHAHVEGRVQGVGFRFFVVKAAQEQGLQGWVRNRYDGRVEVVAEGSLSALSRLLADLRRGPLSAQVTKVDYAFEEARGDFNRFSVLSTG